MLETTPILYIRYINDDGQKQRDSQLFWIPRLSEPRAITLTRRTVPASARRHPMAGVKRVNDITTVPYNVRVLVFHNIEFC